MGTWEGHISPGVAFYTFGVFYSFMYTRQFIMKSYLKQNSYQNDTKHMRGETLYERFIEYLRNFPIDSFMKVLFGFGAAMAELFYPPGTNKLVMVGENGKWVHLSEWQHLTMYLSFCFSGIIDIVSQKVAPIRLIVLEKAGVALAFVITSLLLFYHRHGKTELEQEAHGLLMYATMLTVVLLVAEMWLPSDWKLLFAHTLAVMIMGSWLFHMAFILFPRNGIPWHQGDGMNGMVLPIFFCWHIFFNICVMSLIFACQYIIIKKQHGHKSYQAAPPIGENVRLTLQDFNESDDDETIFRTGYNS